VHLCVLCGSENKPRSFLYTALTDWFLYPRRSVFTARYGLKFIVSLTRLVWGCHQHTAGQAALHFYTVHLQTYHSVRQACQLSTALSHQPLSLSFPVPSLIPRNKSLLHKLSHSGAQELPTVCTNKILITVFTHSFIQQSVSRQVQSLFQSELST
jgi:hypothetical protein